MDIAGRVAIITGGASGIGNAVAEVFAAAGADGIVIADLNGREAERSAKQLAEMRSTDAIGVETDVSSEESVGAMVAATMNRFGRIDILVNNAGICPVIAWDETTVANWNDVLGVNLTGMFICTKAVVPHMKRQGFGRIVYVSSTAASVGSLVAHVAYGVSKAGIIALMKSVAKGFAGCGITANAVSPGTIDTPLTHSLGRSSQDVFISNCVMKRRGDPSEVADAVLYLVSNRATYITGQNLCVDGGFDLR